MNYAGHIQRIVLIIAVLIAAGGAAYGYFPARLAPDPVYLPALLDSIVGFKWDTTQNDWIINDFSHKWNYEYDDKGMLLSEEEGRYNLKNNQWDRLSRCLYTYDSLGHLIQEKTTRWDEIKANWIWENNHFYTYDSSGYLIEESRDDWDALAEKWFNVDRHEYKHDSAGNLCEEVSYYWEQDRQVWIKNILRQYTFDSTGIIVEELTFYGDWDRNVWIKSELIQHFNDSTGILRESQFFSWNQVKNDWNNSSILRYAYDESGNKINEINTWWREEDNEWVPGSQNMFTYDASGNLTEEISSYWDELHGVWEWSRYQQYTYDPSGNLTGEIYYSWNDEKKDWQPVGIEWHRVLYGGSYFYEYNPIGYQSAHVWKDYDSEKSELINYAKNICYWSFLRDSMLLDQVIQLDENCTGQLKLGTMQKGIGYDRDSMTFYIIGGDPDHLFSLDSTSGDLFLDSSSNIDYEEGSVYNLIVQAFINDSEEFKDNALITIRVNNLNDNPPVIQDTAFNLDESTDPDHLVTRHIGNLVSFDPDGDLDPLYHSIISGDEAGNFYLNPYSAALYVWYNTVDFETQDTYSLVIDASDGLFTSQALVTILVNDIIETAIADSDRDMEVRIYPNPASEKLTIEFPGILGNDTRIELRDGEGRVRIFKPEIDMRASGHILHLDLSILEKGVFFISIRSKDFVTTRKFVKL